jgi:hypothetical protein
MSSNNASSDKIPVEPASNVREATDDYPDTPNDPQRAAEMHAAKAERRRLAAQHIESTHEN